jgi:hypothetical protein
MITQDTRATRDTQLAPMRNQRKKVGAITSGTGKCTESKRESDGVIVAKKQNNNCGAKYPCC